MWRVPRMLFDEHPTSTTNASTQLHITNELFTMSARCRLMVAVLIVAFKWPVYIYIRFFSLAFKPKWDSKSSKIARRYVRCRLFSQACWRSANYVFKKHGTPSDYSLVLSVRPVLKITWFRHAALAVCVLLASFPSTDSGYEIQVDTGEEYSRLGINSPARIRNRHKSGHLT